MHGVTGTLGALGFASAVFQGKSTNLIPTADEHRRILETFAPIRDRFKIFTCCDSNRSVVDRFIDPMTYYLGLPNERVIHINSTHQDMVKFSSLNADLMKIIGAIRSTVIRLGPTLQTGEWSSQQVFRLDGAERSGYLKLSCNVSDYFQRV